MEMNLSLICRRVLVMFTVVWFNRYHLTQPQTVRDKHEVYSLVAFVLISELSYQILRKYTGHTYSFTVQKRFWSRITFDYHASVQMSVKNQKLQKMLSIQYRPGQRMSKSHLADLVLFCLAHSMLASLVGLVFSNVPGGLSRAILCLLYFGTHVFARILVESFHCVWTVIADLWFCVMC